MTGNRLSTWVFRPSRGLVLLSAEMGTTPGFTCAGMTGGNAVSAGASAA